MGFLEEAFRDFSARPAPLPHPALNARVRPGAGLVLDLDLTDRGGGVGRIAVLVNGKEALADAGASARGAGPGRLTLDLSGDPRLLAGRSNEIEVRAWNADGTVRSKGVTLDWAAPARPEAPPALWAIVCGVSAYASPALHLRFAAKDAEDFGFALRLAGEGLFGAERTHVALLTAPAREGTRAPTLANVRAAFEAARAARPQDVLVVYLSGHGITQGAPEGDFHYLLAEAATLDLTDAQVREGTSLSTNQLVDLVREIPAVRQVLILDTCASGRVLEQLEARRTPPGPQRRSLDALKDRTGMFVLAGCAADRSSWESSLYGQGLLTYALLQGLSCGCDLREGEYVDAARLLAYAQERVPRLADDLRLGGVQQPLLARREGGVSFDLGRLSEAARARIPLQRVKPVFVRASFQESEHPRDPLRLSREVNAALRAPRPGPDGRDAFVFLDTDAMAAGWHVGGRYVVTDGRARVKAETWCGDGSGTEGNAAPSPFEIEGPAGSEAEVRALAERLCAAALARLPAR